jgi:signal transduction histidine kinase
MSTEVTDLDFSLVLASSVHDMKNSITMMLGTLDDITQQCRPDHCQSHGKLVLMQHEGQRLTRHLIQLLTLYRLDTSQYFLNTGENYLNELFEEIALENELLLNAQGIKMEVDCEEGISGFFDKELTGAVINTIINNAYRYAKATVRLSAHHADGYLVLSIEDDGPGYPPHMLTPFGAENSPINFSSGGTGLGLYFAHRVAMFHKNGARQGYTETSNTGIGNGGRFSIYLP